MCAAIPGQVALGSIRHAVEQARKASLYHSSMTPASVCALASPDDGLQPVSQINLSLHKLLLIVVFFTDSEAS